MTNLEVCKLIEKTAVRIVVPWGNFIIEGSGVIISKDGKIATASHVIHNMGKLGNDILVRKRGTDFKKYKAIVESIQLDIPFLTEPIVIDLALLVPVNEGFAGEFVHINSNPLLGDEVFLAGFPQEMTLPFSIEKKIDAKHVSLQNEAQFKMYDAGKQPMIKKAMIGYKSEIQINDKFKTSLLFFDNAMSPGASGGPVLDQNGNLIGINTSIGIMNLNDQQATFKAPTGTGMAINPNILLQLLDV